MLAAASAFDPPPWLLLPFALLLACVALGPLLFPHFWHARYPHIAVGLGAITVGYYLINGQTAPMLHSLEEYTGFIALVGSLFIVSGGIHITVKGSATPRINCLFLVLGAVLANVIGTTGASMVLIRPWIRMNRYRFTGFHTVFFIFIVSNAGGLLTPIGDPPLFMGYLKGIPFFWVLMHCWEAWCIGIALLVGVFYVLDYRNFLRAPQEERDAFTKEETWSFKGLRNLVFIAIIIFAVLALPAHWRELTMVAAAIASLLTTHRDIHEANDFNYAPLKEVAWLFIGIFSTMVPALNYLQHHPLPVHSELGYYWSTGLLSGALDNAPTYLAFLAASFGQHGLALDSTADVLHYTSAHAGTLQAISMGAVFFGAMTYIGNGPNFMVKAITEHAGVATPGFITYVVRYALPILLPILALVGFLFFSPWRLF